MLFLLFKHSLALKMLFVKPSLEFFDSVLQHGLVAVIFAINLYIIHVHKRTSAHCVQRDE